MADIELRAADGAGVHPAHRGDTVSVHLDESPTSGYRWAVDHLDEHVLAPAGDEFVAASDSRLGGGGTRILRFRVVGAGKGDLALRRWRSWEGESSVAERFGATIDAAD